jgi:hypothetical protein
MTVFGAICLKHPTILSVNASALFPVQIPGALRVSLLTQLERHRRRFRVMTVEDLIESLRMMDGSLIIRAKIGGLIDYPQTINTDSHAGVVTLECE